jgi:integrase
LQESERPYVSPEDIARILSVLPAASRPLFVLAFNTGARLGELQSLSWSRVADDFSKVQFAKTKSGKVREVYCTPDAVATLRELHKVRGPAPIDGPHLVFELLDRKTYLRHIRTACQRLKLPALRVHDARHAVATALVQAGRPVTDVARVLGHANANLVVARYGHHAPENYAETAAAALATAFGQVPGKRRRAAARGS